MTTHSERTAADIVDGLTNAEAIAVISSRLTKLVAALAACGARIDEIGEKRNTYAASAEEMTEMSWLISRRGGMKSEIKELRHELDRLTSIASDAASRDREIALTELWVETAAAAEILEKLSQTQRLDQYDAARVDEWLAARGARIRRSGVYR